MVSTEAERSLQKLIAEKKDSLADTLKGQMVVATHAWKLGPDFLKSLSFIEITKHMKALAAEGYQFPTNVLCQHLHLATTHMLAVEQFSTAMDGVLPWTPMIDIKAQLNLVKPSVHFILNSVGNSPSESDMSLVADCLGRTFFSDALARIVKAPDNKMIVQIAGFVRDSYKEAEQDGRR